MQMERMLNEMIKNFNPEDEVAAISKAKVSDTEKV